MAWTIIDRAFRIGLSTDPRPTSGILAGLRLYEADTGDTYVYTGTAWVLFRHLVKLDSALSIGNVGILSLPSLIAGEAHIGEVGGNDLPVVVTPAIAAAAFSANDIVGGKLTLANAMRVSGGSGVLDSLALVDTAKQNAPLIIHLFNADLAGSYIDNAAEAVTAPDWLKWLGCISILTTDYLTEANASLVSLGGLGLKVKAATGTSLFGLIVTRGVLTYTANCLQLTFGFGRN